LSRPKLIKQLKEKNPQLNQSDIEIIIDTFSEYISQSLVAGNNIEIRGLGRWYCKKLKENFNLRNPATSELIYRPERVKIRFRASKKLNKLINE
tara:strand:- start:201 stop:482 length:282 start_codon:yes stop_codon:yes gene_type:complete